MLSPHKHHHRRFSTSLMIFFIPFESDNNEEILNSIAKFQYLKGTSTVQDLGLAYTKLDCSNRMIKRNPKFKRSDVNFANSNDFNLKLFC